MRYIVLSLYGENKHIPILAVSRKAQEISVQIVSLSKGFNIMSLPHAIITVAEPGMRAAWMRQIQAYGFGYAVNSFSIAAVTSIMNGEADEWLEELTAYLHKNLEETMEFIHKYKLPLVPYVPEEAFCCGGLQTSRNWDRAFRPVFHGKGTYPPG